MTVVRRDVAIDKEEKLMTKLEEYDYNKQMPVATTTLIRKLFLKRIPIPESFADAIELWTPKVEVFCVDVTLYIPENIPEPNTSQTISDRASSNQIATPSQVILSSNPCQNCSIIALDRFVYMKKCLSYYNKENDDLIAKHLMLLCETLKEGVEFNETKISLATTICNYLKTKISDNRYKFIYIWQDLSIV